MAELIEIGPYQIEISNKSDEVIPDDFLKCQQIHSSDIYIWNTGNFQAQQGDGIITHFLNKKIAVRVADCNAIILMGKQYFGIIHAGWRGLKGNIMQKAIKILNANGENEIQIFIGPSIRKCCYEVGQEFRQYFQNKYLISNDEKLYLDMLSVIQNIANENGVKNIVVHPDCTYCSDKYFSYRRGDKDKRMIISVTKIF